MRLAIILLAACGATSSTPPHPKTDPTSRGLRADQHLDAARDHARRADELSRWPEMRRNDFDDPGTGLWYRRVEVADEHQQSAAAHRSAAAELHAAYDEACADVAPEVVRMSPLQRHGLGGMPITDGVVVFLGTEAGPPARLLAEIRCHRAWMMLSEAGMEQCPLDLPNIRIEAHGDKTGISLEIRIKDRKLVAELQRRAAADLEVSASRK